MGPKQATPSALNEPPRLLRKSRASASVSRGARVGKRASAIIEPCSSATAHTNLLPPASTPPEMRDSRVMQWSITHFSGYNDNCNCQRERLMNVPSATSRAMIERLIAFNTVSRDSNLGLIEWVRDYLSGFGPKTRLTHDASGKKANLFATLGDSPKRGLILSGHTDVVPVDGQQWDTDPFVATERGGKLFARGSADMKGFIGIILAQAPKFLAAINSNKLDAPLHYALSY